MRAGSMYTLNAIGEQYQLSQAQRDELHQRLSGKATLLDDDGLAWYRYCDIFSALRDLAALDTAVYSRLAQPA